MFTGLDTQIFTSGTTEKRYQTKILHLPKFLFRHHILFYQAQEKGKKKVVFAA